uniref:Uncharacterized protein n=1 Tax=Leptocylindrus danicus TaxID=163516 RepID=A0A6U2P4P5_9STRA|mmetsp:Transcript_24471/g.36651  ORF Transcript_24471/g.36651 Transcript_24471/m.36651 type:complete len:535 (+) Transcript_24471:158-1762(+)
MNVNVNDRPASATLLDQSDAQCNHAPRLKRETSLTGSMKRKWLVIGGSDPDQWKSILKRKGETRSTPSDDDVSRTRDEGFDEIVDEAVDENDCGEPSSSCCCFRDENRAIFRECFIQGLEGALGMTLDALSENRCAIQATVLEDNLFEELQSTAAYRSQSCVLQSHLADFGQCPLLCARILVGEIDVRDLIFMSPMDLKKHGNAAVVEVQHVSVEVSPGAAKKCFAKETSDKDVVGDDNLKVQTVSTLKRLLSIATAEPMNDMKSTSSGTSLESLPSSSAEAEGNISHCAITTNSVLEEMGPYEPMNDESSSSSLLVRMQANAKDIEDSDTLEISGHEGLDEELQFSPQVDIPEDEDIHEQEEEEKILKHQQQTNCRCRKYIELRSGCKLFKLKISGIVFRTFLVYDECLASVSYRVNEVLFEFMESFERCKVEEMNDYMYDLFGAVQDTVPMCKWKLIPIRMSLTGCKSEDIDNYCKFCKKYEEKERVAIFKIDRHTKIFLVPPKLVDSTECLSNAGNQHSAYVVILTDSEDV